MGSGAKSKEPASITLRCSVPHRNERKREKESRGTDEGANTSHTDTDPSAPRREASSSSFGD